MDGLREKMRKRGSSKDQYNIKSSKTMNSMGCAYLFIYFIYFYLLEANCFTVLWWFLSYIGMNQP